jgi:hypothetical protein
LTGKLRDWIKNKTVLSLYQAAFVNGKRIMYNNFVIKIMTYKYLGVKIGSMWGSVVFETAFESSDRVSLWLKMRQKRKRGSVLESIREV